MAQSKTIAVIKAFSSSPKSGKTRFKFRTLSNFALAIGIFLPLAVIFALLWRDRLALAWLADAVTIAILFFVYRQFWNKRAIWIKCPHCKKKVSSKTPWVCGACEGKNENPDDFPFLHRCQACNVEPPSYQCHHLDEDKEPCGELIFLTNDESLRNYAYCLNPPYDSLEGKRDPTIYGREKRWREYKLSLTRLDIEVKRAEQEFDRMNEKPAAAMTPEEKVEASWMKHKAKILKAKEILHRVKKSNAEEFKDDPQMRNDADEAIQDWYDSGVWERQI